MDRNEKILLFGTYNLDAPHKGGRIIGEILKQLEETGLSKNTIVVYFSDHGANNLLRHKQMLTELKVGDEISTAGGMLGKIMKVGESYVQLKISDTVEIKLQKSSVNKILPKNSLESIK